MTNEERIDWLCRLRADLNNGVIFTPWNNEFTEALTELLEQQPCEDAISREKAIKQCGFGMTSLLIADCLKRLPSVTPSSNSVKTELEQQTRWIPVSERLPDTTDEVLVTDGVDMMVAWHDYTLVGWASFDSNFDTDVPIKAWMPLPQPYKAESEGEEV